MERSSNLCQQVSLQRRSKTAQSCCWNSIPDYQEHNRGRMSHTVTSTCISFWSSFMLSRNFLHQSDMPRNFQFMFIVEVAVFLVTEKLKATSYEEHVWCSLSRTELTLMPTWPLSPFYLPERGTIFLFVYAGSLSHIYFSLYINI